MLGGGPSALLTGRHGRVWFAQLIAPLNREPDLCRRCGAPDRRPGAQRRRVITQRLLDQYGNGVICPCFWCARLIGRAPGYLAVAATASSSARRIPIRRLERDRLIPGGPYSLWNLVPSCPPCNKARGYTEVEYPEGCWHGNGERRVDPATGNPIFWEGPDPDEQAC